MQVFMQTHTTCTVYVAVITYMYIIQNCNHKPLPLLTGEVGAGVVAAMVVVEALVVEVEGAIFWEL